MVMAVVKRRVVALRNPNSRARRRDRMRRPYFTPSRNAHAACAASQGDPKGVIIMHRVMWLAPLFFIGGMQAGERLSDAELKDFLEGNTVTGVHHKRA